MAVVSTSKRAIVAALRVKFRTEQQQSLRAKYAGNPVLWTQERAKGVVWSVPAQIMQSVVTNRRTAVPSAHAIGKSWLSSRLAAWWIDNHPPGTAFVVTTAPSTKQVKAVLWKEIHRAWTTANLSGRLNQTEWWLNDELVAMGRKPSNYDPTAFQGIHAKYVLVIYDEACGIPENIFLAGNSLAANEFSRLLAIGNPDDPDSYFAKICQPGSGWNVIPVSAFDTPNFTGEDIPQEVRDSLVSQIYVDEMRQDVGEDSPVYTSKVLGRFPENKADGVIPLSWIRNCQDEDERNDADESLLWPIEIGMDVGAGGDETSLRVRYGKFIGPFVEAKTPSALEAFDIAVPFIMEHNASRIKIDAIGVGWGLIGLLEQAVHRSIVGTNGQPGYIDERTGEYINLSKLTIVPVNVGVAATDPEKFARLRSQMWWQIGRLLSQDRGWNLSGLDEQTIGQLVAPTYHRDAANRIVVESKKDTMDRTKRPSPNRADALLLAFCEPPSEEQEFIVVGYEPEVIGPDI